MASAQPLPASMSTRCRSCTSTSLRTSFCHHAGGLGNVYGGFLACVLLAGAPARAEDPEIRSVEIVGTAFRVTLADGRLLAQDDLVGAVLDVADEAGHPLTVRIDAYEPDPLDATGETILYTLAIPDGAGGWENPCPPGPDGRRQGFPLGGRWPATGQHIEAAGELLMTCTAGAIGKCVRNGYRPWAKAPDGQPLWSLHQTCVRLFRADYCGSGHAYTRNGTPIDVFDSLGIQKPANAQDMSFEAAFDVAGALCVARPRLHDGPTLDE